MPYKIEWKDDHSKVFFSGELTFEELRQAGDSYYGDERLDAISYLIADFRDADVSQISFKQANKIASLDSISVRRNPKVKMAFVVQDDAQKQLCEHYIEYSKQFQSSWLYKIFNSFDEARNWCLE